MSLFTSCERLWPPRLCTCGYSLVLTHWIAALITPFSIVCLQLQKNVTCNYTDWSLSASRQDKVDEILRVQWAVEVFLIWSLWCIKVVVKTQHSCPASSCLSHDISHDGLASCFYSRLTQCSVFSFHISVSRIACPVSACAAHFNCKLFWSKKIIIKDFIWLVEKTTTR